MAVISSPQERLLDELDEELRQRADAGLLRRSATIEAVRGAEARLDGRWVVNWCSNDFLGLSSHPALAQAAAEASVEFGVGARGSRLLSGTTRWHTELEQRLAAWFGSAEALVYPSGYQANLGTLGALLSAGDAVFVDRLAHASVLDAARATRATFRVFHHNDAEHLDTLLARASSARRRLVVTEGVFSMDGDSPPLPALLQAAEAHRALVYLDDAHGAFILGERGRGTPEAQGIAHERLIYMATLGKALGCQGGFIIGPQPFVEHVRNTARTFIYTTALATPVAAAACAALRLLKDDPQRRLRLAQQVARLHGRLASTANLSSSSRSHIVPIVVGGTQQARQLSQALWDQGIWAPAIRPPTVPEGTARLRLGVTALHTDEQIDRLVDLLAQELPQ